jgi:hypothetical protein
MSAGKHVFARIAAVHLGLSELPAHADAHLKKIAKGLKKFNPNWPDEARDEHGRWEQDGNGGSIVPVIAPFSPECLAEINAAIAKCVAHYTTRGGNLGPDWMTRCVRGYVPSDCGY